MKFRPKLKNTSARLTVGYCSRTRTHYSVKSCSSGATLTKARSGLILFRRNFTVVAMNGNGGDQRKVIDFALGEAISPDATRIAYSQPHSQYYESSSTLRLLSLADGTSVEIGYLGGNQTM